MNVNSSRDAGTRWLAGFVFGVTIVAYVILTLEGHDTNGLVYLTGPILAALFVVDAVGRQLTSKTAPIARAVEEVKQQTNGVLDQRIHDQVRQALTDTLPSVLSTAYATQPSEHPRPPSHATLPPTVRVTGQ